MQHLMFSLFGLDIMTQTENISICLKIFDCLGLNATFFLPRNSEYLLFVCQKNLQNVAITFVQQIKL